MFTSVPNDRGTDLHCPPFIIIISSSITAVVAPVMITLISLRRLRHPSTIPTQAAERASPTALLHFDHTLETYT